MRFGQIRGKFQCLLTGLAAFIAVFFRGPVIEVFVAVAIRKARPCHCKTVIEGDSLAEHLSRKGHVFRAGTVKEVPSLQVIIVSLDIARAGALRRREIYLQGIGYVAGNFILDAKDVPHVAVVPR